MLRSSLFALVVSLMLPAMAQAFPIVAAMDGSQEVPATGSSAVGAATLDFDKNSSMIDSMVVTVSGIALADVTGFHIHLGEPGENGPVIVDLLAHGSFMEMGSSIVYMATSIAFPAVNVEDLLRSDTYLNLHTTAFPGGEIRGQLRPVPEPASAALFTLGALVVGAATRRNPLA